MAEPRKKGLISHGIASQNRKARYDYKIGDTVTATWNNTAGGAAVGDSYLVNITSRLENAIAGLTANYNGAWIGGYRSNTNSYAWVWADGPEKIRAARKAPPHRRGPLGDSSPKVNCGVAVSPVHLATI